jgi:PAS domain S-box-containing protein
VHPTHAARPGHKEAKIKTANAHMAAILDNIPDLTWVKDIEGRYIAVNPALARTLGFSDTEAIVGKTDFDVSPKELAEAYRAADKEVMASGERKRIEELHSRPDDGTFWIETIKTALRGPDGRIIGTVGIARDLTERKLAEAQQKLLLDELNHRVKNTSATVLAIAHQTRRTADTPAAFHEAFEARLLALSETHNLLTQGTWQSTSLHDLVQMELAPYEGGKNRFVLTGTDIQLSPEPALTLGMVFHELTTNAAKYGALSSPLGQIQVNWNIDKSSTERRLHIEWHELGGPLVKPPRRKGFGTRLIEMSLGRALASAVNLEFQPQGLRCVMDLRLDRMAMWT